MRKTFAAVILAVIVVGCGGGSTPLSPSPAGVAAERTHGRPAYSVLYSFKSGHDGDDGRDPHAGPLIKVKGTLYGTTVYGGGPCHDRCFGGTVFAITTSGTRNRAPQFRSCSRKTVKTRGQASSTARAHSTAPPSMVEVRPAIAEPCSRSRCPARKPCSTASKVTQTASARMRASFTSTARSTARPLTAAQTATERSSRSRPPARKPYSTASQVNQTAHTRTRAS